MKILLYIILSNLMWGISIAMCYLHRFIDNLNYTFQDFLITLFELFAWVVLIVGAIDTFPKDRYSNKRVWFCYAIMGGCLSALHSFVKLTNTLMQLLQECFQVSVLDA